MTGLDFPCAAVLGRVLGRHCRAVFREDLMLLVTLYLQVDSKMSLVTMPFYQRRHKHFDQSYRNIQTRYLMNEYAAKM